MSRITGYTVGARRIRLGRFGCVTSLVDISNRRRVCVYATADDAREAWAQYWSCFTDAPSSEVRRVVRRKP